MPDETKVRTLRAVVWWDVVAWVSALVDHDLVSQGRTPSESLRLLNTLHTSKQGREGVDEGARNRTDTNIRPQTVRAPNGSGRSHGALARRVR